MSIWIIYCSLSFKFIKYWHPYELRHTFRDFAANSPRSYIRLGQNLQSIGLCLEGYRQPNAEEFSKILDGIHTGGDEYLTDIEKTGELGNNAKIKFIIPKFRSKFEDAIITTTFNNNDKFSIKIPSY